MLLQRLLHPPSVLASVLAAAATVLTVAGCSHVAPLGPDPTRSTPVSRHLGSPIIAQVMRSRPTATGRCPAGWLAAVSPPAPTSCYRPVGSPVTITSAAVSAVSAIKPPPGSNGPVSYGFVVELPTADVSAVTAAIKQAYESGDSLGISVAGRLWEAPKVLQPFSGRQFEVSFFSRNQALQLHRILVPQG